MSLISTTWGGSGLGDVAAQHEEVSFSLEWVDQVDFSVCVLS